MSLNGALVETNLCLLESTEKNLLSAMMTAISQSVTSRGVPSERHVSS